MSTGKGVLSIDMDDANSLYIGGLSHESNEESLREVFREHGEIVAVKIVYDRDSGESRGFGFVTFADSRAAAAAIRDVDGAQIEGRTVRVNEMRKNLQKGVGGRGREIVREGMRGASPDIIRGLAGSQGEEPPYRVSTSRERSRRRSPAATKGSSLKAYTPRRYSNRSPELKSRSRNSNRSSTHSPPSSSYEDVRHRKLETSNSGPIMANSKLRSTLVTITAACAKAKKGDQIELQRLKREVEKVREVRRGLEDKIASLNGVLEKTESTITALRNKSKKLEESLANALQMASLRQAQLRKLQKGVFRLKLSAERLASSEKEMKDLVAATLITDHGPENNSAVDAELEMQTTNGESRKSVRPRRGEKRSDSISPPSELDRAPE